MPQEDTLSEIKELKETLEKWMLHTTQYPVPSYSEIASEQNKKIDSIEKKVDHLTEMLTNHTSKYKGFYSLVDKSGEAVSSVSWIAHGIFLVIKWTVVTAGIIAAFMGIIKGWWFAFITSAIRPFIL